MKLTDANATPDPTSDSHRLFIRKSTRGELWLPILTLNNYTCLDKRHRPNGRPEKKFCGAHCSTSFLQKKRCSQKN